MAATLSGGGDGQPSGGAPTPFGNNIPAFGGGGGGGIFGGGGGFGTAPAAAGGFGAPAAASSGGMFGGATPAAQGPPKGAQSSFGFGSGTNDVSPEEDRLQKSPREQAPPQAKQEAPRHRMAGDYRMEGLTKPAATAAAAEKGRPMWGKAGAPEAAGDATELPSQRVALAMVRQEKQLAELGRRLRERFGEIRLAFLHLDTNRDSVLDAGEFKRILQMYNFDAVTAEDIVLALDGNSDGKIEFHEFVDLLDNDGSRLKLAKLAMAGNASESIK